MKPSKLTLTAAKEFGQDILSGNIFRDESLLVKLYNTFFNKKIEEINDFVEYICRFLNDSQIYQLVEKLLAYEAATVGKGILRQQKTLGKYLFIHEIKKSAEANAIFQNIIDILNEDKIDPERLLRSIAFPQVVYQHYKSIILPLSLRVNASEPNPEEAHFQYMIDSVLFHVLNTIIMEKLCALNNPLMEAMLIKVLTDITSLNSVKNNYNGINSLIVRQILFAKIDQCVLPNVLLQNSSEFAIEKFKSITELLLILNETMVEANFNEKITVHLGPLLQLQDLTKIKLIINAFLNLKNSMSEADFKACVTTHFDSLMQIKDPAALAFALKKLEPVPFYMKLTEFSIFGTATDDFKDETIGAPKQFQALTVDMSKLNDNDSIENIRIRFKKLVMSIHEIMNVPADAKPQTQEASSDKNKDNNEVAILQAFLANLSQFSPEKWSALPPRTIKSLTNELKTSLSELQLKTAANSNSKELYNRVKTCLDNLIVFENSCKQQEQQTSIMRENSEAVISVEKPVVTRSLSDANDQHPLLPPTDDKDKAETSSPTMGK